MKVVTILGLCALVTVSLMAWAILLWGGLAVGVFSITLGLAWLGSHLATFR